MDAIGALYAPDAIFYSHPFRAPHDPVEYVAREFADQQAAECRFGEPVVDSGRAAVDWWAVVTSKDGSVQSLAGTSLLRFDEGGRVVEERGAWGDADGHHELPQWAT